VCCRPSSCISEASAIAKAYIDALRSAYLDRKVPAGGFWGNFLTSLYGGAGEAYPNNSCPGLMCGGWQDLAQKTAGETAKNSSCWVYRTKISRNLYGRWRNFDTHTWGELSSVNGGVILDPWPSGGMTY
jgi:hypothetical protein